MGRPRRQTVIDTFLLLFLSATIMQVSWIVKALSFLLVGAIVAAFFIADRPSIGGRTVHWHLGFLVVWHLLGIVGACVCGFLSEKTIVYLQGEHEHASNLPFIVACAITSAVMLVLFALASFAIAPSLESLTY